MDLIHGRIDEYLRVAAVPAPWPSMEYLTVLPHAEGSSGMKHACIRLRMRNAADFACQKEGAILVYSVHSDIVTLLISGGADWGARGAHLRLRETLGMRRCLRLRLQG